MLLPKRRNKMITKSIVFLPVSKYYRRVVFLTGPCVSFMGPTKEVKNYIAVTKHRQLGLK